MWNTRKKVLNNGRIIWFAIKYNSSSISFAEVLCLWQKNEEFRTFFLQLLASSPFLAYRWETPPITTVNSGRPFEFVMLDSPDLERNADVKAFEEHFRQASSRSVIQFSNLGGDAILVVPCPGDSTDNYCHLASFSRSAPKSQQHKLWEAVGAAMQRRISPKPVWLSTAGGGVAWLHIRLDDRPKYYSYKPYRENVDHDHDSANP